MGANGVYSKILGREYTLKLNANAVAEIEEQIKAPIYEVFDIGFRGIRALLWGAIATSNNRFKINQSGEMIDELLKDPEEYQRVVADLAKAFRSFFNGGKEPEEVKEGNPQMAPSGA